VSEGLRCTGLTHKNKISSAACHHEKEEKRLKERREKEVEN
jgi:hypothetical protein